MPRKQGPLNARQERFCRAFAVLANATYAAAEAGYHRPNARNQGYRLLKEPAIRMRIAEIQAEMARETCRDTEVLLGKLENVYRRAIQDHHYYAAARAVDLQAKLAGMRRTLPADKGEAGRQGEE
jgi:phage terminase small subunit